MAKGISPTVFLDSKKRRIMTGTNPRRYVIYTGTMDDAEFFVIPAGKAKYYAPFTGEKPILITKEFDKVKIPPILRSV